VQARHWRTDTFFVDVDAKAAELASGESAEWILSTSFLLLLCLPLRSLCSPAVEHWSLHHQPEGNPLTRMTAIPAPGAIPPPFDEAGLEALLQPVIATTRPVPANE